MYYISMQNKTFCIIIAYAQKPNLAEDRYLAENPDCESYEYANPVGSPVECNVPT